MPPKTSEIVRIQSEPEGAEIFLGDSLLGTTPINVHNALLPELTAWYPSRSAWNATVTALPDSAPSYLEGIVFLEFAQPLLVLSSPSNAAVYCSDSLMGYTPLRTFVPAGADTIFLSKPGYVQQSICLSEMENHRLAVILEPCNPLPDDGIVQELHSSFSFPSTYVLVAATVGAAAGIAAVILKQEADSKYVLYSESGSESALDSSRNYDLYSGIALAILQLSLVYLVYELFINT
jgi:hypothetical protein